MQSKFVADLAPSAFKFENTIMDTGYPRTDILYSSNNEEEMGRLKEKLGLPKDKKSHHVCTNMEECVISLN